MLTCRPFPYGDTCEHTVQLFLILRPLSTHHGHAHGPDAPAQQRHPSQLDLRKPAASAQHTSPNSQRLDHIKIRPANVVGNNDSRLSLWQHITRHGDLPTVENFEDALDPVPIGESDERRGVVDPIREKVTDWQEGGEDQVHHD